MVADHQGGRHHAAMNAATQHNSLQTIIKTSRLGAPECSDIVHRQDWNLSAIETLCLRSCVRNAMTRTMTAVAAAALVAVAAIAAPTEAEARRGWWVPGAVIGGLAAGAIIAGSAGAYGPYGYGPGPGYYAYGPGYGPGCYLRRERVWDGYGWVVRRVRVCY
jgi:hypothetical protein